MAIRYFEGRMYETGISYTFDELPPEVREDLWRQEAGLELAYGRSRRELRYTFRIIPAKRLRECLARAFGKDLDERIQEEDVAELAADISRRGLKSPPVESEGWHRALAMVGLDWAMPYFEVAETPRHEVPAICRTDGKGLPPARRRRK